jgi:hypothetical protein
MHTRAVEMSYLLTLVLVLELGKDVTLRCSCDPVWN